MVGVALAGVVTWLLINPKSYEEVFVRVKNTGAEAGIVGDNTGGADSAQDGGADSAVSAGGADSTGQNSADESLALNILEKLEVKGRAPKTGYTREEFYGGWPAVDGCNLRQRIIKREFGDTAVLDGCNVLAGEFDEPYTGEHKVFKTREEISKGIQIDHVVALSDAWQKGAQYFSKDERYKIATDPLNLLAVDASANGEKSDGDAATWLPPNKKFRCQYVVRQVSVKYKYALWVTEAEKTAIYNILVTCPGEKIMK